MRLVNVIKNPVGRKLFMALTGLAMAAFLVVHLLGNTTLFAGSDALNIYAATLHRLGPLVWVTRLGLAVLLAAHVGFGVWLTLENRRARPEKYAVRNRRAATFASQTMIWSGLVLLAFIVLHLAHFTLRLLWPEASHVLDGAGRPDVFLMVTENFRHPLRALVYVGAMAALFCHLAHGLQSLCQTFGLNNDRTLPVIARLGLFAALALAAGFAFIPLWALGGF